MRRGRNPVHELRKSITEYVWDFKEKCGTHTEPFSLRLILTSGCGILKATVIQRNYGTEYSETHVKALLLADANRLFASPSEYKAIRQQIAAAAYQTFTLNEVDFNDLVFMEANDNVWADNQTLVDTLSLKESHARLERS